MKSLSILLLIGAVASGNGFRDSRATRMSVVDFWKNETHGDGLNLRVAHGVNSWPALVEHLQEPFLNKSMMLEGDVFLQNHRRPRHRAIPVMSPTARVADRMTFKEWLREVATLRKAIKINFRTTDVVHPVLEYLHAAQFDPQSPVLDYPLILHADVFKSYKSHEAAVDPKIFVRRTESLFPDATLSLGWTKQENFTDVDDRHKKLTWRQLLDILEYVARLDQPVMLSVRLTVAAHSKEQLLWLLGMDRQLSLLIWSDKHDQVSDWTPIFELRRLATKNRVLYDLLEEHREILQKASADLIPIAPSFSPNAWRAVVFSSSSSDLSTVVLSERGPAFLGRPTSLLLSSSPSPKFPGEQIIEGRVHFLPKRSARSLSEEETEDNGVVVYLLDRVQDVQSPKVEDAVEVFIGQSGRISIERKKRHNKKMKNKTAYHIEYDRKAVGQAEQSSCYDFRVLDQGFRVTAEVTPVLCRTSELVPTTTTSSIVSKIRHSLFFSVDVMELVGIEDEGPSTTTIQLNTPIHKNRVLRSVAVAKRGDDSVDFILEKLTHSPASITVISYTITVLIPLFTLFFLL